MTGHQDLMPPAPLRLTRDLAERVEAYRRAEGLRTTSEAIRRLISAGLATVAPSSRR